MSVKKLSKFLVELKKLKFWGRLYTVGPAKHARWVMGLSEASLNLYQPGSGKPVVQTKAIIHTAYWAMTVKKYK